MPEFLNLMAPDEARNLLFRSLPAAAPASEMISTREALGRIVAADLSAPHPLPEFPRSTVDGFAVRARDTFGTSDSLPAYLALIGEVPMGGPPAFALGLGECGLIHTGGMLPEGADSVVMLEHTQYVSANHGPAHGGQIEILRAAAPGENVIRIGEDVAEGQVVLRKGQLIRPAEVGGLMALGILALPVAAKPRVGLISTGDEVVPAEQRPAHGQVRDVNAHTLAALVAKSGGQATSYGIIPDRLDVLQSAARRALDECDLLLITAGSSASARDMTAEVINSLGAPGVLVHGINTRPGKPTILGVCHGKAVVGLPGNPVSALVNGYLFVVPVIEKILGARPRLRPTLLAQARVNLASQAGREDWWPVRLISSREFGEFGSGQTPGWIADPIFGKSNLIFNLADADGLLRVPVDATGVEAGQVVEVWLI